MMIRMSLVLLLAVLATMAWAAGPIHPFFDVYAKEERPVHNCMHDRHIAETAKPVSHPVRYEDAFYKRDVNEKRRAEMPIRIRVDYSLLESDPYACIGSTSSVTISGGGTQTCSDDYKVTTEKVDFLKGLVDEAAEVLTRAFSLVPVAGNLTTAANTCGTSDATPIALNVQDHVKTDYQNVGYPADFVIFISMRPTDNSKDSQGNTNVIAFASYCDFDSSTGRPLFGYFNFHPDVLDPSVQNRNEVLGVSTHEITHALGLTKNAFQDSNTQFYNKVSGTRRPKTEVVTTIDSKEYLITAKLKATASAFFNCTTLPVPGVEIENGGGSGTAGSHWEKRILNYEYMIGAAPSYPVFSQFTLAYFEDAGWYTANYSMQSVWGVLTWGSRQGCDWLTEACSAWPESAGLKCSSGSQDCTNDRRYMGACTSSDSLIGTGCAYYGRSQAPCEFSNEFIGSALQPLRDTSSLFFGEGSRCFRSNLRDLGDADITTQGQTAGTYPLCYKATCASPTNLKVAVQDIFYDCPYGETIQVINHGGNLRCPGTDEAGFCSGSPVEIWPEFVSIAPTSGRPGTSVLIVGRNLVDGMEVWVGDAGAATDCVFNANYSATEQSYSCKQSTQKKTRWVKGEKVSVVLRELPQGQGGKSVVGFEVYKTDISLLDALEEVGDWIADNPIIFSVIIVGICAYYCCCWFCCCSKRGKEKRKQVTKKFKKDKDSKDVYLH